MIISEAFASTETYAGLSGLAPFIIVILIFYVLLIRPQQKKIKEHENLVENLKKGDEIVTTGGIFGKIVDLDFKKNTLKLRIADNVEINILNHSVTSVLEKEKSTEKKEKKRGRLH